MEAAALKGETVNLMDLPTEILARIIEDVYWDSQDESALSFGPSLQSLTLGASILSNYKDPCSLLIFTRTALSEQGNWSYR